MTNISHIIFILSVLVAAFALFQFAGNIKLKKEIGSYQNIFQHANDALLLIDIIDGKIEYANLGAKEMLGYPLSELVTMTIFDIHSKDQLAHSSEVIATVYEQKGLIYTDLPFISASGEKIDVECSAKVIEFGSKPMILISARNIRERIKMEEQIQQQSAIITQKNKDLIDSITYAKNIQHAILPSFSAMQKAFPEMFVVYQPKDIVSGDFYWYNSVRMSTSNDLAESGTRIDVVAVVDCTGHGVPGAFMSLVGYTLLNQTLTSHEVNSPADLLTYMSRELVNTLNRKQNEIAINDGMDMSVCAINRSSMTMNLAAANHVIYLVRNGEILSFEGDKQAIGLQSRQTMKPYTNHHVDLEKGDIIYLFTDGMEDQFGGEKGKKYKSSHFREFLLSIHAHDMNTQGALVEEEFNKWKGNYEQLDDVLVMGIKI